jgi:hypothetical protein
VSTAPIRWPVPRSDRPIFFDAVEQNCAEPKTVRKIEDAPPDTETLATLPELRKGRIALAVVKLAAPLLA